MKIFLLLVFSLFVLISNSQITSRKVNGWNVELYIPAGTTTPKPAFIFFPGNGEVGTDKSKLYTHGPMRFIRDAGWRPNFIVIACQLPVSWSSEFVVATFIDTLLSDPSFKIDPYHFVLSGLSGGAYSIHRYMQYIPDNRYKKPSAVVPFSITMEGLCGSAVPCGNDARFATVPAWGIAGWYDSHHDKMKNYFFALRAKGYPAKWTTYALPVGSSTQGQSGHCCWNTYYDPNWKEGGQSIYAWAMSQNNTALSLGSDSLITRTRQRLSGYFTDFGTYFKVYKRGLLQVYRIDGSLTRIWRVVPGQIVQKDAFTDVGYFIF